MLDKMIFYRWLSATLGFLQWTIPSTGFEFFDLEANYSSWKNRSSFLFWVLFTIRISYCSADATFDHVFAFIATNRDNTMECHAFLCPKVHTFRWQWFNIWTFWLIFFSCREVSLYFYFLQLQRKMAQAATLTIAQAFNLAFQVRSHTHIHKHSKRKT